MFIISFIGGTHDRFIPDFIIQLAQMVFLLFLYSHISHVLREQKFYTHYVPSPALRQTPLPFSLTLYLRHVILSYFILFVNRSSGFLYMHSVLYMGHLLSMGPKATCPTYLSLFSFICTRFVFIQSKHFCLRGLERLESCQLFFLARLIDQRETGNIQMEMDGIRCSWMYQ